MQLIRSLGHRSMAGDRLQHFELGEVNMIKLVYQIRADLVLDMRIWH